VVVVVALAVVVVIDVVAVIDAVVPRGRAPPTVAVSAVTPLVLVLMLVATNGTTCACHTKPVLLAVIAKIKLPATAIGAPASALLRTHTGMVVGHNSTVTLVGR
jgi:hypothetical protein